MKPIALMLPLALVVLGIAAVRFHYFSVVDKVSTSSDEPPAGFVVSTPAFMSTPLCGTSGKGCNFSGLYGTPVPKRGITAPGR
jgi:hypothetical protein